jgi:hypothetical protein
MPVGHELPFVFKNPFLFWESLRPAKWIREAVDNFIADQSWAPSKVAFHSRLYMEDPSGFGNFTAMTDKCKWSYERYGKRLLGNSVTHDEEWPYLMKLCWPTPKVLNQILHNHGQKFAVSPLGTNVKQHWFLGSDRESCGLCRQDTLQQNKQWCKDHNACPINDVLQEHGALSISAHMFESYIDTKALKQSDGRPLENYYFLPVVDMWIMQQMDFYIDSYSTFGYVICWWRGLTRANDSNICAKVLEREVTEPKNTKPSFPGAVPARSPSYSPALKNALAAGDEDVLAAPLAEDARSEMTPKTQTSVGEPIDVVIPLWIRSTNDRVAVVDTFTNPPGFEKHVVLVCLGELPPAGVKCNFMPGSESAKTTEGISLLQGTRWIDEQQYKDVDVSVLACPFDVSSWPDDATEVIRLDLDHISWPTVENVRVRRPVAVTQKYKLSICLSRVYGIKGTKYLIEFFEYHRAAGVDHVVYYAEQWGSNADERSVLDYYQQIGFVTVVDWSSIHDVASKLAKGLGISHFSSFNSGLTVARNDCYWRMRGIAEYVAMSDIDEILATDTGDSFEAALKWAAAQNKRDPKIVSFAMHNNVLPPNERFVFNSGLDVASDGEHQKLPLATPELMFSNFHWQEKACIDPHNCGKYHKGRWKNILRTAAGSEALKMPIWYEFGAHRQPPCLLSLTVIARRQHAVTKNYTIADQYTVLFPNELLHMKVCAVPRSILLTNQLKLPLQHLAWHFPDHGFKYEWNPVSILSKVQKHILSQPKLLDLHSKSASWVPWLQTKSLMADRIGR